jgi:thiol-disulfide isomerase/thioredoxin
MIKYLYLSLLIVMSAMIASAQQKPFTIKGTINGKDQGYIYLSYDAGEKRLLDSALIENGKFSFKGNLPPAVLAVVMMDKNSRSYDKWKQIYLVPATMKLQINYNHFEDAILTGSPVQSQADELMKLRAPIIEQMKPLSEAYSKLNSIYIAAIKDEKDEATLASLKESANTAKDAMEPLREQLKAVDIAYMDKHPSSFVSASMLRIYISDMNIEEAAERYNKLTAEIKGSSLGKEIKNDIEALRMGSPGASAYMFTSKELKGGQLSLADYKGKFILLDFWASWCVPCRKGNPHLLSLYSKYKDKGLEIIGISDDDSKPDAWSKAVEKDKIGVWKHVLRGLKWTSDMLPDRTTDISDHFGIHTLPTKILIDPNGVIIGRYGGGGDDDAAMDKKFSEIFGS